MQSMLGITDALVDMAMLTMEYLKGNNPLGNSTVHILKCIFNGNLK